LFGLPAPGPLPDPFQLPFQGLLPFGSLLAFLGKPFGFLIEPATVVTLPGDTLPPVELQDPAGYIVEEIPVVGHGYYGSLVLGQVVFEPMHRFGIEVVGGFIQQEDIRFLQQQAAKGNPAPFPA